MASFKWVPWSEGVITGVKGKKRRQKMRENIAVIAAELDRRDLFTRSGPHDVVEEEYVKQIAAEKGIDLKLQPTEDKTEESLHSNGHKHQITRR